MTDTITLPVTGRTIVDGGYVVKAYKELQTRNGVAFTANLYCNGKKVGVIENQGNGGGSWFSPASHEANATFRAWVAENKAVDASKNEEELIEELVSEAEMLTQVRRRQNKAYLFAVNVNEFGRDFLELHEIRMVGGAGITLPSTLDDVPAKVLAMAKAEGDRIWSSNGWLTI